MVRVIHTRTMGAGVDELEAETAAAEAEADVEVGVSVWVTLKVVGTAVTICVLAPFKRVVVVMLVVAVVRAMERRMGVGDCGVVCAEADVVDWAAASAPRARRGSQILIRGGRRRSRCIGVNY
jgi:hypothetical protein